jgi:hypothetical protein
MRRCFLLVLVGTWLLVPRDGTAQTGSREKGIADFYWRTGHYSSAEFYAQVQQKREKKETPTEAPEQAPALEQLIAEALKNNPDVRVAEAKVHEAEAQLARTRTLVAAEISALQAELKAVQVTVDGAMARYQRMKELAQLKSIDAKVVDESLLSLMKAEAELAVKQAKLPFLLGKPTQTRWKVTHIIDQSIHKAWEQNISDAKITDDEFIRRAMLDILGRTPRPQEIAKFKSLPEATRRRQLLDELIQSATSPSGANKSVAVVDSAWTDLNSWEVVLNIKRNTPLTDKLRKALDTPIKLKVDKMSGAELMAFLRAQLPGINLLTRVNQPTEARGFAIEFTEPVPLGAFLQFIEDDGRFVFILRDYGIIVVAADEKLPPGALRVTDFWKHAKAGDAHESKIARTQVKGPLTSASQAYYIKHAGTWPPNLDALLRKDKFSGPYLEAHAILDPWGKSYQYDIKGPRNNGTKPDIWTVAPDGAIIGNWPEVRAP